MSERYLPPGMKHAAQAYELIRGTGLSRRAAQQALDGLKGHGLLSEIVEIGKANEYGLNWQTILEHSQNGTSAESSLPPMQKVHGYGRKKCTHNPQCKYQWFKPQ